MKYHSLADEQELLRRYRLLSLTGFHTGDGLLLTQCRLPTTHFSPSNTFVNKTKSVQLSYLALFIVLAAEGAAHMITRQGWIALAIYYGIVIIGAVAVAAH